MECTEQLNPNECGVCAICSLVRHYYHTCDKAKLLDEANISPQGLSIFEFEVLALSHGIFVETYSLEWNEFYNFQSNKYLVCLTKGQTGMHYVVIRKRQNQIEVWDSAKGYQVKTYKEFAKVFGNVMMIVTKKKTNLPPILNKKTKILKSINVKYLLLSVLLNVLAISLSIAGAKYLTMVIDNSITSESFSNFISISILFGFLYIMEGLTNYVLHIYSTMFVKTNFCYLSHRFLQKIRYKNKIFYSKVDKNQIMLMDNAMTAIAQHYAVDITAFVTNIFLCFACIIIICSLNLWFLIIVAASFIFSSISGYFYYTYNSKLLSKIIHNESTNNMVNRKFIDCLGESDNAIEKEESINKLMSNYFEYQNLYCKKQNFSACVSLISHVYEKIAFIICVMICTYSIITKSTIDIGDMLFIIALTGIVNSSIDGMSQYILKWINFKKMREIYLNFVEVGNVDCIGNKVLQNITKVEIIHNTKPILLSGNINSVVKKYDVDKILTTPNDKDSALKINDLPINEYLTYKYIDKLIVLKPTCKLDTTNIKDGILTNNQLLTNCIRAFKFDITEPVTFDQQLIVNLLALTQVRDYVIYLKDYLKHISTKYRKYINQNILQEISQHNVLMYSDV